MPHHLDQLAEMGVVLGAALTAGGAFYKWVLLPNLREQLFKPMEEVRRQVGDNGGKNDPPTMPDRFHALQESVDDLRNETQINAHHRALMQANLSSIVLVLEQHLRGHAPSRSDEED